VAVKIRLKRLGKVRVPQYRIVVVDSRKKRDGKVIEEIGKYHPKEDPSYISVVSERAQYWLGVGAQPSEAVAKLLKVTGDWQTHKGYQGTEGTLRTAEPKPDKLDLFNKALQDAHGDTSGDAVTKKTAAKKTAPKQEAPTAEAPAAAAPAEEAPGAEAPAAEEPAAEEPAAESAAEVPAPNEVPGVETPEGAAEEAEVQETAAAKSDMDPDRPDADKRADKGAS
jgi:small subunit ribosomal protein S16